MTDPTDTEDGIADIERLRGGGTTVTCGNCANAYDEGYTAGHNAENARLREQAVALATALADARRWMMATNDYESLSPAGHSLTRDAISTADAALRAYREATQ